MNQTSRTLATCAIIASLGAASPALGAEMSDLPPVHEHGAVKYITGGVGLDEADAFKHAAAKYPLEMLFVEKAGSKNQYLANVKISVLAASGTTVLETTAEGPFLLADMPDGRYTVEAEYRGEQKRQKIEIRPGSHHRVVFVWTSRNGQS